MRVRVNCPIPGCGILIQAKSLEKHLANVHQLDGKVQLRLHPTSSYTHTPGVVDIEEEELEPEPAREKEPEKEPE